MSIFVIFGLTLLAFLLVVGGMAVGVLMGRRSISGSCGGLGQNPDAPGESSCSLCSDPAAACRELGKRMQAGSASSESDSPPAAGDGYRSPAAGGNVGKEAVDAGKQP